MRSNKLKPLVIGDITIEHPLALAPMAGVTDLPYRLLCKEQGAGMMCTEMVSAKGLYYGNRKSEPLMATSIPATYPLETSISTPVLLRTSITVSPSSNSIFFS